LRAYVEDQFGNPINNQEVKFVMGGAREKTTCDSSNNDTRPGLLVSADDPCMNTIPIYGQCGNDSLNSTTSLHIGAVAQVILGGLPNAGYPITIISGSLTPEEIIVTSNPVGKCDEEDPPYVGLMLKNITSTDSLGHIIEGGAIGATIPLYIKMYMVREYGKSIEKEFECSSSRSDTCPVYVGTGEYYTDTDFVTAAVKFDGLAAEDLGDGLFKIDYPLSTEKAMKHEINEVGEATITVTLTDDNICSQETKCQLIDDEQQIEPITSHTNAYTINVTIPKEKYYIQVNEDGYVTADYPIEYTIEPADYTAASAFFVLSKETAPGQFENIGYFNSNTSGTDQMTFLRGFRFDQDSAYKAQVVLNLGSEYMEVQSAEMTLVPLTLELDADLNRDGAYNEDDPAEHEGVGLVVQVNNDDDDGDNVLDWVDGFNLDEQNGTPDDFMLDEDNNPVDDNELVAVKFTGQSAGLDSGTVSLEIVSDTPRIRIWRDQQKGNDAQGNSNLLLDSNIATRKIWVLGTDIASLSELPQHLYIEGLEQSAQEGDVELICRYKPVDGPEFETDRIAITVINVEMKVDENRSNTIEFYKKNDPEPVDKKYTFWINDDHDIRHHEEIEDGFSSFQHEDDVEEIVPLKDQDWNDNYIGNSSIPNIDTCKRDLEDFAMLQFKISDVLLTDDDRNFEYVLTFNWSLEFQLSRVLW
ncbi:MAG: hypothetical protein OEV64_15205, partial [Desulfobulbaceae bacterium]|nr:hypothetical protein [Desulfobulbaceae bacterium]